MWVLLGGLVAGFVESRLLYERTHGHQADLPELAGIVIGGLTALVIAHLVHRDERATVGNLAALSAVGLGVAANRLLLSIDNAH